MAQMMKICRVMMMVVIAAGLGCAKCTQSDPVVPMPSDSDMCAEACAKMIAMGCEEGQPITTPLIDGHCTQGLPNTSADGGIECRTSCEQFCIDTQSTGVFLNPTCIVEKAQVCSDIESVCATNPKN